MSIDCSSLPEFLDIVAGLVERGLTFQANAHDLTSNLTGGF